MKTISLAAAGTFMAASLAIGLAAAGGLPGGSVEVDNVATEAQVAGTADVFGISFLKPTLKGGTYWVSDWGQARKISGVDPEDSWFDAAHGSATLHAAGSVLYVSGETPRMYVHDPRMKRQWGNIEATIYFKRVSDSGIPYAGMTIVARANHLVTETGSQDRCDTRGYGGRIRFDGYTDFEKETSHPFNQATRAVRLWRGGMPYGVWIGMKYLVWDESDGVHLQVWRDLSDGVNGGNWQLMNTYVDHGNSLGQVPCAPGINPQMKLTASPSRYGSESGLPNASVFFRSDGIGPNGLEYKWASVREISAR